MREQVQGERMHGELLVDLAAHEDDQGVMRYAAAWSSRQPDDPEALAYLGPRGEEYNTFRDQKAKGFGVVSIDSLSLAERDSLCVVFLKGHGGQVTGPLSPLSYARELADGSLPTPGEALRAERLEDLATANRRVSENPQIISNYYHRGIAHFRNGNDEAAIADMTRFIDGAGTTSVTPDLVRAHERPRDRRRQATSVRQGARVYQAGVRHWRRRTAHPPAPDAGRPLSAGH